MEFVVMDMTYSAFFQPLLIGATVSNVKSFEGIPMLLYTMGKREKTFQVVESESQQTLIMLSEGIIISKGVVINMNKRTMPFTEIPP